MEYLAQFTQSRDTQPSTTSINTSKALFDFSHLRPHVQRHLLNVYTTLTITMAFSVVGALLSIYYSHIVPVTLTSILSILCLIALPFTSNPTYRQALLYGFGLCKGISLGPLITLALHVDASIVPTALAATLLIFACFTTSALLSHNDRRYLYWGGMLSSALSVLALLSLAQLLFGVGAGWNWMMNLQLYGGLLLFALYVLYDTQLIVAKCEVMGSNDHVMHALELYMDLVAIFVRILIILTKNKAEKKKNDGNKRKK